MDDKVPWFQVNEPDTPATLVPGMDDRLEAVGLPTYTAIATLLRDVLQPGAAKSDIERARQAVRDIGWHIALEPPQSL